MLHYFFERFLIKKYISVGEDFGDAISYSFMGEIVGFDSLEKKFKKLEKKIIEKGYIPYSIEDFVKAGGYGHPLPELKKYPKYNKSQVLKIIDTNDKAISYSKEMQTSDDAIINQLR